MKLLDELRLEKESTRPALPDRPAHQPRAQQACDAALRQAMADLYAHLAGLARGLDDLASEVPLRFDVPSMGTLDSLHPRAFRVIMTDPTQPRFEFSYRCVGHRGMTRLVETRPEYDALLARLQALDLTVSPDAVPAMRHVVRLKPDVPVVLTFAPCADGRRIGLNTRNLGRLGRDLFSIHPDEVGETLVEELGRLILGRKNRFLELTGNALSADALSRLRARLGERAQSRARGMPTRSPVPGAVRGHGTARQAPVLLGEHSGHPDAIAWSEPADTADALPAAAASREAHTDAPARPRYAWVVTCDLNNLDTTESIARRGPPGSSRDFPSAQVVAQGADFRLTGADGKVRYTGMILGAYRGDEPLLEFGLGHGCSAIAYLGEGGWAGQLATS